MFWRPQPPPPPLGSCSNLCPDLKARRSHKQILLGAHLLSSSRWSPTMRMPTWVGGLLSGQHSGCLEEATHEQVTTLPLPQGHPALSIPVLRWDGPPGDSKARSHWKPTKAGDNPHHKEAMQQEDNSAPKICSFGSSHHCCVPTWDMSSMATEVVQGTAGRGKQPQKFCNT